MYRILNFAKYFLRAKTAHNTHSPFAYNFVQNILNNKYTFYAFEDIESIRAKLLLSNLEIEVTDLGAGSKKGNKKKRKVANIVRYSAKSKKFGELLFKIVNEYKCKNILELGTSFGISTMYLACASNYNKIITIEGCANIAKVANINFSKLNLKNICSIIGNFDHVLPEILKKNKFDLIFIDGNHKKEPLLTYTEMCLPHLSENGILIIDDINWSKDMNNAWNQIVSKNEIKLSIDLFELGICFTNKSLSKEHIILRY